MPTYRYRGYDGEGRARRGLVEALGSKQARQQLSGMGVLAEVLDTVQRGGVRGFDTESRAVLYRSLGAFLEAGVPLAEALGQLVASGDFESSAGVLARAADLVREGWSFAGALGEASPQVGGFERAMLEASERSAAVGPMLARVAGYLEHRERVRQRVQGALIYPAIVATTGVCLAIVMLGVLLPKTRELFGGGAVALPWLTRAVMRLGELGLTWGVGVAVAAGLAVAMLVRRARRDVEWGRRLARSQLLWPVVGPAARLLAGARFARTLGMLLEGGVPIVEAVRLAGEATGNRWLADQAGRSARRVEEGSALADALAEVPVLQRHVAGWVRVGEASGSLARLLEVVAVRLEERWERLVSRTLQVAEPLLILAIGGFVLVVALAVLLPVIRMTHLLR